MASRDLKFPLFSFCPPRPIFGRRNEVGVNGKMEVNQSHKINEPEMTGSQVVESRRRTWHNSNYQFGLGKTNSGDIRLEKSQVIDHNHPLLSSEATDQLDGLSTGFRNGFKPAMIKIRNTAVILTGASKNVVCTISSASFKRQCFDIGDF